MKNIRYFVLVALAVMAGNFVNAQNASINAGYISQTTTSTNNGNSVDVTPDFNHGFFVGVNYNYDLKKGLGVSAGLNLEWFTRNDTTAGNLGGVAGASWENHYNELAVVVPIFLNYRLPLGPATLKLYAGPVIGYTFYSKYTYNWSASVLGIGTSGDGEYDYLSEDRGDNQLSPLSLAIAGGVGIDFNSFGINAGYSYGLSDRYGNNDNLKSTNTRIFVGLNYNL